MNAIFKPYLRKFVLVFFDDILVFSSSLFAHLIHLRTVLDALLSHQLFAKKSKCVFGCSEVEYLGHIILGKGVQADPKKISAMHSGLSYLCQGLKRLLRSHRVLQEIHQRVWFHSSTLD